MGGGALENTLENSENLQKLEITLESLSNIDPSQRVRELADTLRESITQCKEL